MLPLQRALETRFPDWFRGLRAPVARAMVAGYGRFSGWPVLQRFVEEHAHLRGLAFVEAALEWLDCRYLVDQVERERIPESGRVLVVANHPMGGLDALALLACVGSVRRDVKIVANDVLLALDSLSGLLLPVATFGDRRDLAGPRAVMQALESDAAVIVFPAAEVSRLTWQGVRDAPWREGFLRIARRCGAPLLPVRIEGRNSALFYGASMLFRPLGTPLLPRELRARRGTRLVLRIGEARRIEELDAEHGRASPRTVQRAVQALGRPRARGPVWRARHAAIAHRVCVRQLYRALDALPMLGETRDGKRIHAGQLATDSPLLREIARLRETSFRLVGEGTGRRVDTDVYDSWYDHIVLWDAQASEIAGAYRAAPCRRILRERGMQGLYSTSLFEFDPTLAPMLEQGVELGRSFIAPSYRGTRSLDDLWYGIGAWLSQQSEIRYLFGPVSISAALPRAAREWIVGYYSRYFGASQPLARAAHPFRFAAAAPDFGSLDATAAMELLRRQLDTLGARIPVLYRQYVELCEPGGVDFLAFGVDADFNDSIDGLIRVDLARVRPARRARYLQSRLVMR